MLVIALHFPGRLGIHNYSKYKSTYKEVDLKTVIDGYCTFFFHPNMFVFGYNLFNHLTAVVSPHHILSNAATFPDLSSKLSEHNVIFTDTK